MDDAKIMRGVMWQWIHKAASPKITYRWAQSLQPWIALLFFITFIYGLIGGLLLAPPDYQQGDVFRIIYVHVPTAIGSLGIYAFMAISAVLFFIWKIKIADIVVKVSAPIGALFTVLTLIAGSVWGKPTWGTYWVWDARLTSELILLFIYLGIIGIRSAIPDMRLAAKASGLLVLIGAIDIPIIHYSVDWWNTLHQGASLSLLHSSIAAPMLHPLLSMILAFFFYYCWMLTLGIRSELLKREKESAWVKEIVERGGI